MPMSHINQSSGKSSQKRGPQEAVPAKTLRTFLFERASEKEIQDNILEWLSLKGMVAFHIPNHGKYDAKTNRYNITDRHHVPGVPDICVILKNGKTLWIEVKRFGGPISRDQLKFLSHLNNMGHLATVAHSVEETETFMRTRGLL